MKRIAIVLCACALAAACDDARPSASDELTIVVQGDRRELEQQEKSLREREESLKADNTQLDQRISELARGLKAAADLTQRRRLEDELRTSVDQASAMVVKESALKAQKSEVEAKKQSMDADATRAAQSAMAAREAQAASREAKVSEREATLALRDREFAQREKALAARETQAAAREQGLATLTAQNSQQAEHLDRALREVPKGAVVEAKHKKVLAEIDARGILVTDLPPEDQPLNADIFSARRLGDFSRAWDLVVELTRAVTHLKVDQKFVEQKMVRLQGARAGARLSEGQRGEVEKLLREVTASYSDGQYEQANKVLNRISAILDANTAAG